MSVLSWFGVGVALYVTASVWVLGGLWVRVWGLERDAHRHPGQGGGESDE